MKRFLVAKEFMSTHIMENYESTYSHSNRKNEVMNKSSCHQNQIVAIQMWLRWMSMPHIDGQRMLPIPAHPYFVHEMSQGRNKNEIQLFQLEDIPSAWMCRLYWDQHGILTTPEQVEAAKQLIRSMPGKHRKCAHCQWDMPLCCIYSSHCVKSGDMNKKYVQNYKCNFCHYRDVSEVRIQNQNYYIHVRPDF